MQGQERRVMLKSELKSWTQAINLHNFNFIFSSQPFPLFFFTGWESDDRADSSSGSESRESSAGRHRRRPHPPPVGGSTGTPPLPPRCLRKPPLRSSPTSQSPGGAAAAGGPYGQLMLDIPSRELTVLFSPFISNTNQKIQLYFVFVNGF